MCARVNQSIAGFQLRMLVGAFPAWLQVEGGGVNRKGRRKSGLLLNSLLSVWGEREVRVGERERSERGVGTGRGEGRAVCVN